MTKKPSNEYQGSLYRLTENHIPYDKKIYESITPYIQEHLWKHMDKDRVKKAAFVLDDPLHEYDRDFAMIKQLLKSFLPTTKKHLHVDKEHLLKDQLGGITISDDMIDRYLKQQLNIYYQIQDTSGGIVNILQEGPKKSYIDKNKSYTKEIINDQVPDTQKSIIANLMIFMILQKELQETTSI